VVNTASYCGFTPQYEGLEKLYAQYAARGFTILGFRPATSAARKRQQQEIADFCYNTYGVKFPMFTKSSSRQQRQRALRRAHQGHGQAPKWNFHKYLIGRDGKVVHRFPSQVER